MIAHAPFTIAQAINWPTDDGPYFIGYGRVSERRSADSDISIPVQIEDGSEIRDEQFPDVPWFPRSYCAPKYASQFKGGAPQDGWFVDHYESAWKRSLYQRPAGMYVIPLLRPGWHLVVHEISRMFRSIYHFCKEAVPLAEAGVNIHFVQSDLGDITSADGHFMACFLALYAQWKSDTMSERIKEGNAAKRAARDEPEKRQIVRVDKALSLPSRYRYLKRKTESLAAATPGTFYTYARKSHSDVHPERLMKAQLDNALRYGRRLAQKHPGLTLSDQPYIDDGVSAYKVPFRGRPAGKLLFEMVKPGDCIGFGRFDRAFRNPIDARQTEADLRARGVSCHFCNVHIDATTAIGQAMLTILATLAELEAAEIGMKMKAILGWLADQGRPVNQKTPRGWYRKRFGKCIRFEPDWQEIDRIQVAHYLHKELGWTLWSISDLFEQQIAEEENRSMLPRHGTGEVGGRGRAAYRPRRWRTGNLWYAIQEWPELAEMLEVS